MSNRNYNFYNTIYKKPILNNDAILTSADRLAQKEQGAGCQPFCT